MLDSQFTSTRTKWTSFSSWCTSASMAHSWGTGWNISAWRSDSTECEAQWYIRQEKSCSTSLIKTGSRDVLPSHGLNYLNHSKSVGQAAVLSEQKLWLWSTCSTELPSRCYAWSSSINSHLLLHSTTEICSSHFSWKHMCTVPDLML